MVGEEITRIIQDQVIIIENSIWIAFRDVLFSASLGSKIREFDQGEEVNEPRIFQSNSGSGYFF